MTIENDASKTRLSAFVGRSFLDQDEAVWATFRAMFESLAPMGFRFEDAKGSRPKPVSDKVKAGISRNTLYIAILTRRERISTKESPTLFQRLFPPRESSPRWTTSNWVVQEIGYAIGRDLRVLRLIESGVEYPATDLDADREWIGFERGNIPACFNRLTAMIATLIAETIPPEPITTQKAEPPSVAAHLEPSPPSQSQLFADMVKHLREGNPEAAELAKVKLIQQSSPEEGLLYETVYLGRRAANGDEKGLAELHRLAGQHPSSGSPVVGLSRYFATVGDHRRAADVLIDSLPRLAAGDLPWVLSEAAIALKEDGRSQQAKQILKEHLNQTTDGKVRAGLWKSLSQVAVDLGNDDIESGALEAALEEQPTDLSLRFDLAYKYSKMSLHEMSAFHYGCLENNPTAHNNLGIEYEALGWPFAQIEEYEAASAEELLARANLAHVYLSKGFAKEAKMHAEAALASTEDNTRLRARTALDEVENGIKREREAIEKLGVNTRDERRFRHEFAQALLRQPTMEGATAYSTPFGSVTLAVEQGRLVGRAEEPETGLLGLLSVASAAPGEFTRVIEFAADLEGASGTFRCVRRTLNEARAVIGEPKVTAGLLVILPDRSLKFLVKGEKKNKVEIGRPQDG